MSPLSNKDLHRIFDKMDKDGDGFVSLKEVQWLLEKVGVHASTDEILPIVGKTNLDRQDFEVFYETIIEKKESHEEEVNGKEEDLGKAFKVYDLNGDGFITSDELQTVLSEFGLWTKDCGKDCKTMINEFDSNSDGMLDFEEFKKMMVSSNKS